MGGDVIVAVDGESITDFEDLTAYLARYANVGQTIEITFLRDGEEQQTSLTLSARPGEDTDFTVETSENTSGAWLGITGVDMNDEIAEAMGLKNSPEGALIQQITAGSPADEAGLQGSYMPFTLNDEEILIGGDIITTLDKTSITGISNLASVIGTHEAGDTVTLTIIRDGKEANVEVTLTERP